MEDKNFKPLKYIILIVLFIAMIFISHYYSQRKYSADFDHFDSSFINGTIECEITGSVSGTHICVNSEKYTFVPFGGEHEFKYRAEVGDTIFKESYSDTLWLFKNGKEYYYLFK